MSKTSSDGWPLISVIIHTYNSAATIGPVLDSIENLDYPRDTLELVIVDGGSTDNTVNIIEKP
jgi:glycosyltransferase involved in cell wall biosynthesis